MSAFDVTPGYLYGCACHEAGHAVALFVAAEQFGLSGRDALVGARIDRKGAGFLLDFRGRRVDETRGLFTMASTWTDKLRFVLNMSNEEKKRYAEILEAHTLILLAGPYAEVVSKRGLSDACLDVDMDTGRGDLCQVDRVSKVISSLHLPHGFFPARSWIRLRMDARALVRRNWTAIEAIASRLYEKGELSGEDAYDIFVATPVKLAA